MTIKGDLSRIDLANIFQMLSLNQNEGTLNLYYGGVHKSIYFTGSGIIMPFDIDTMEDRVLSLLVRTGRLKDEEIERARYNTTTLNTGLLGAILQMRYVSEEDVRASYLAQMEEDIYDLFLVKDAHFEFLEGEKPSGDKFMDERFMLSPNNLLMEAVRRGDEWAHIQELVPSEVEVFEIVAQGLPDGVDDPQGEFVLILSAIDGVRSVKRIIEVTHLHRFTVFKNLSLLVEGGKIAPIDFRQLVNRADESNQAGRTWDAIDLYERAINAGIEDADLFEKAGNAYRAVSENKKACTQFYRLSELFESRAAMKQAMKVYQNIRELLPTELVARERIFQIYLNNQELFDDQEYQYNALTEGTELALIFKEIGRNESALQVVNLLFDKYSNDSVTLEEISKLALDIRQPSTALNILEYLGERLLEERDSTNSLRIFRRIKCIDPEHRGIDDKLDRLIESDLTVRKKRGRLLKTALLISLLLGLIVTYFIFNSFAFNAFSDIPYDDLMTNSEYEMARDEYEKFCAKFPLSIYWFLAMERLDAIDGAQARYDNAEALRREYETEEAAANQKSAENLFADAVEALANSELENALRLLKRTAELAQDTEWLEAKAVETKIKDLETYFSEAEELKEKAQRCHENGKFAEEHGYLVGLITHYASAPCVEGIKLPLLVKSNPSGARIVIGGEEAKVPGKDRRAYTPTVLEVFPSREIEIRVEKEGFMAERRMVDLLTNHELTFEMRFQPERQFSVGPQVAYPPVKSSHGLILGFRNGRIKCFQPKTGKFPWTFEIPKLQSLESPLRVYEDKVYFSWGQSNISAIDAGNGEQLWEKELSSPTHLAPVEWGGMLFVALDSGKIAKLDLGSGELIGEINCGGKPVLEPITWEKGLILALEDGRILWIDDSAKDSSIPTVQKRLVRALPTAVFCEGDDLVIGNSNGGIDCFNRSTAQAIFSHQAKEAVRVSQLILKRKRVYAVMGERRILAIDTSRGTEVTGTFSIESGRIFMGVTGGQASISVGSSDSSMYLLRSSDLSLIRKYRAVGEIAFPGVEMEGYVYFYSSDGALNGLRY